MSRLFSAYVFCAALLLSSAASAASPQVWQQSPDKTPTGQQYWETPGQNGLASVFCDPATACYSQYVVPQIEPPASAVTSGEVSEYFGGELPPGPGGGVFGKASTASVVASIPGYDLSQIVAAMAMCAAPILLTVLGWAILKKLTLGLYYATPHGRRNRLAREEASARRDQRARRRWDRAGERGEGAADLAFLREFAPDIAAEVDARQAEDAEVRRERNAARREARIARKREAQAEAREADERKFRDNQPFGDRAFESE